MEAGTIGLVVCIGIAVIAAIVMIVKGESIYDPDDQCVKD